MSDNSFDARATLRVGDREARVDVEDNGPGISPAQQAAISLTTSSGSRRRTTGPPRSSR